LFRGEWLQSFLHARETIGAGRGKREIGGGEVIRSGRDVGRIGRNT
jgi:hypothetical protein